MKTSQCIIDCHNSYDEDSRLGPEYGTVGFLTAMRYIERHMKPGSHVPEIGAGTGRYFHALARQRYVVDAVELVPHSIKAFHRHMLPAEHITITQDDALDLSAFSGSRYDITLLLGPPYHLYNREEKRQVSGEVICVTKQGDIIFAAHIISGGCLLDEGLDRGNINAAEYIENGLLDLETFAAKSEPRDLFGLVHKEDIDDLMPVSPITCLHYTVADGRALLIRGAIDKMDDETFKLYLKYYYTICEQKDLTDITSYAVDIFRK